MANNSANENISVQKTNGVLLAGIFKKLRGFIFGIRTDAENKGRSIEISQKYGQIVQSDDSGRVGGTIQIIKTTCNKNRDECISRLMEEKAQLTQELSDALEQIVMINGKALEIKRRQLAYQDAYGNWINEKFYAERDYFIKTVMRRDVLPSVIEFLSLESHDAFVTRIFHESFAHFLKTKNLNLLEKDTLVMSPVEYEQYCADLLEGSGWTVSLTKAVGDQGIDVIATFETIKVVGQCKLYSNPVGNAAVQEIIAGRAFEQADYAFVVSNSTFTPAAISLAGSADVLLMHDSELSSLHCKFGISMPEGKIATGITLDEINPPVTRKVSRPISDIMQQAEMLQDECSSIGYNFEYGFAEDDPLYPQAVEFVIKTRKISISLIQRHLTIGYNRAAHLIEQMERVGLVGPMNTAGGREVIAK